MAFTVTTALRSFITIKPAMIDLLVLRLPFFRSYRLDYTKSVDTDGKTFCLPTKEAYESPLTLKDLRIPLEAALDEDGEEVGLRHPWESIPSSYSNLAFKVFDFREMDICDRLINDFYVELKASPAKLKTGHNLFGSDDLRECAEILLDLFFDAYPHCAQHIDLANTTVEQIDVTYHSWCRNTREATQFVNALQNVSHGQTRGRTGYSGTAYFGKSNSQHKKIKVYVKLTETQALINKDRKKGKKKKDIEKYYSEELLKWSEGMVRWEASLKKKWFETRDISKKLVDMCKVFDAVKWWQEAMKDIFEALKGKEFRMVTDENVEKQLKEKFFTVNPRSGKISYGKAMSAYRVFRGLKSEGWNETKRTTANGTFYNAIEMLTACDLSLALLQNLKGDGLKCEVIPFIRYIEINFNEQVPSFAKAA